jgi:6-methylsalicylate decarboxylase
MSNGFIDVHHHLIPSVYRASLQKYNFDDVAGQSTPDWSPEISLGVLDRNGIDFAFTSISAPGVHFGDSKEAIDLARRSNEFSAELIEKHPTRFGSFAALPMPDVASSVAEVKHALDDLHLDGVVMMSSHFDGSYLGDPKFDEVMSALNDRDAVVFIHPAIPIIAKSIPVQIPVFAMEFTFDTTRAVFNLAFNGVFERFPRIKWILSHAGGTVPYLVDRFELLWLRDDTLAASAPKGARGYLSQLYYDTALSSNMSAISSLRQLVDDEHILFGSDFPFGPEIVTMLSAGAISNTLPLEDELRSKIRRENALKLFPGLAKRLG